MNAPIGQVFGIYGYPYRIELEDLWYLCRIGIEDL
jgi:hypothetical protein